MDFGQVVELAGHSKKGTTTFGHRHTNVGRLVVAAQAIEDYLKELVLAEVRHTKAKSRPDHEVGDGKSSAEVAEVLLLRLFLARSKPPCFVSIVDGAHQLASPRVGVLGAIGAPFGRGIGRFRRGGVIHKIG